MEQSRRNRPSSMLDRRPSTSTAAVVFALYMGGAVLLITSVWVGLAGVMLMAGELGDGRVDRLVGAILAVGAVVAFLAGRRMTGQFTVRRRS